MDIKKGFTPAIQVAAAFYFTAVTLRNIHVYFVFDAVLSTYELQNQSCPEKPKTESVQSDITPLFNLNPDKFIIPVLIWGPSNQLDGLKDTIALAIRFNRTLVLPDFYYHNKDPHVRKNLSAYNDILDPSLRLSIKNLRRLLPVIYRAKLGSICPHGPDAIWPAREMDMEDELHHAKFVHFFDYYQGMKITNYSKLNASDVEPRFGRNLIPKGLEEWPFVGKKYPILGKKHWSELKWEESYGNSTEKCVIRLFPYKSLHFDDNHGIFNNTVPDITLGIHPKDMERMIIEHMTKPDYVEQLAEFLFEEIKVDFSVSLHWRYNLKDWMRTKPGTEKRCKIVVFDGENSCANLERAIQDPDFTARAFLHFLIKKLNGLDLQPSSISLFLAYPPDTAELMEEVRSLILKLSKKSSLPLSIKTATDIQQMYEQKITSEKSCHWVADDWYEIKSLVEQHFVEIADIFIFAERSTWSDTVRAQRNVSQRIASNDDYGVLNMLHDYSEIE